MSGCRVQAGRSDRVNVPSSRAGADMTLHPEVTLVALLVLMHLRISSTGGVLHPRTGAAMMAASMIDPPRTIQPSRSKISFCAVNSFSPSLASGTCPVAKSRPMNRASRRSRRLPPHPHQRARTTPAAGQSAASSRSDWPYGPACPAGRRSCAARSTPPTPSTGSWHSSSPGTSQAGRPGFPLVP